MSGSTSRRAVAGVLLAATIAGCGGGRAGASAAPASSANEPTHRSSVVAVATPPPATPSHRPSLTPRHSPPAASASTEPAELFAWLPPIDPTVDPAFEVDEFVTPAVDLVPFSGGPGEAPYPASGYVAGTRLVVVHGPIVVDGIEWYLVAPAYIPYDDATAWVPARSPDGTSLLAGVAFACPAPPLTDEELGPLGLTDALPACYGHSEITIIGELTCDTEPDAWVTGATWLEGGTCHLPSTPTVYGLDARLPQGRYAITGHFDDPEAAVCQDGTGGTSKVERIMAILACRRGFVARGAVPAP